MITMEMLGKIRRTHLREKLAPHEIAKRTVHARNTIRAWLRKPEPKAVPKYQRRSLVQKLDPFCNSKIQTLKAESAGTEQQIPFDKTMLWTILMPLFDIN